MSPSTPNSISSRLIKSSYPGHKIRRTTQGRKAWGPKTNVWLPLKRAGTYKSCNGWNFHSNNKSRNRSRSKSRQQGRSGRGNNKLGTTMCNFIAKPQTLRIRNVSCSYCISNGMPQNASTIRCHIHFEEWAALQDDEQRGWEKIRTKDGEKQ